MNGIKRKSVIQEVIDLEYNGSIKSDEEIADVVNFYDQYEWSDVYKTNGRFVRGY